MRMRLEEDPDGCFRESCRAVAMQNGSMSRCERSTCPHPELKLTSAASK